MRVIRNFIGLLMALLLLGHSAGAQAETDSAGAARSLVQLLALCRQSPGDSLIHFDKRTSQYIIYRGDDTTRKWKSYCDPQKPDELWYVQETCGRIYPILENSAAWAIIRYRTAHESEGQWHVLEVAFKSKEGKETRYLFAFLRVASQYGLGDIDRAETE